jgi:flagellar basal-body rod protein FlgB
MESLFGKTFNLLSTMLDFRSERNKVITSNISNLDSVDYKAADYVFKEDLRRAIERKVPLTKTNEKHFPIGKDEITKNDFKLVKSEERADLDKEMTNLVENQLMFNVSAELLSRKFKGIKNVLTEVK